MKRCSRYPGFRLARVSAMLLSVGLLAACARDVEVPPYALDDALVQVLTPPLATREAEQVTALLREVAPDASAVPYAEWPAALDEALTRRGVVVIPDTRRVPQAFQPVLRDYIERGGKALFLGRSPFEQAAVPTGDGEYLSQAEHEAQLADAAEDTPDFSSVQLWSARGSDPSRRATVRVAEGREVPRPGVRVEFEELDEWMYMCLPEMPEAFSAGAFDVLTLYVRGSARTTRLVARAQMGDGSVWVHDMPVDDEWRLALIRETEWVRVKGGETSEEGDAGFRYTDLTELCVGVDARYAVQSPGPHVFGLSDIRGTHDPRETRRADTDDPLFLIDPGARHTFSAHTVAGTRSEALFHTRHSTVEALRPEPMVRFPDEPVRWAPLFTAQDRNETTSVDVAGLFIRLPSDDPPQMWAWIGLDADRTTRRALRTMINECLFHLQRGRFLVGVHTSQAAYTTQDLFRIRTRISSANPLPGSVRVAAELVDQNGSIVRRMVSAPYELAGEEEAPLLDMNVGVVPNVEDPAADYEIRVALEEVGGRLRVFDRTAHPVKVLGPREPPTRGARLGVSGSRITRGGMPVFFLGIDYDPGLAGRPGMEWLAPSFFPAALVKRDMERLRTAGVNTLSLVYTDPAQAPQLRYVMEEARAQGMWIQLRLPTLLRRVDDQAWLELLVAALELSDDENVVALDLAPAGSLRTEDALPMLQRAWNAWLREQYGAVSNALAAHPEWLEMDDVSGEAVYPLREQWAELPDEAAAWPLLRRFAADYQSRRMGRAVRALRDLGCDQLITARMVAGDTDLRARTTDPLLPFDFGTGRAHTDFATVSADAFRGHEPDPGGLAFLAAYARGWLAGGPVLWADMGVPVGPAPREPDYENQRRAMEAFFELVLSTHTTGAMLRHFAPISTDPLAADEGLVDPARTPRPALRVVRAQASRLRDHRVAPMQWAGREAEPDTGARGLPGVWDDWRRVYRDEAAARRVEGIRPVGYDRSSLETPGERLGDAATGPFLWLNGEWGRIEVNGESIRPTPGEPIRVRQGEPIQLELINSGLSRWAASRDRADGTVWVEVRHEERREQYLEVHETRAGRRVRVEWRPRDAGTTELRPYWLGAGAFGEALHVEVLSPGPAPP